MVEGVEEEAISLLWESAYFGSGIHGDVVIILLVFSFSEFFKKEIRYNLYTILFTLLKYTIQYVYKDTK